MADNQLHIFDRSQDKKKRPHPPLVASDNNSENNKLTFQMANIFVLKVKTFQILGSQQNNELIRQQICCPWKFSVSGQLANDCLCKVWKTFLTKMQGLIQWCWQSMVLWTWWYRRLLPLLGLSQDKLERTETFERHSIVFETFGKRKASLWGQCCPCSVLGQSLAFRRGWK